MDFQNQLVLKINRSNYDKKYNLTCHCLAVAFHVALAHDINIMSY
jgi:hypothetical protein